MGTYPFLGPGELERLAQALCAARLWRFDTGFTDRRDPINSTLEMALALVRAQEAGKFFGEKFLRFDVARKEEWLGRLLAEIAEEGEDGYYDEVWAVTCHRDIAALLLGIGHPASYTPSQSAEAFLTRYGMDAPSRMEWDKHWWRRFDWRAHVSTVRSA